ncbi:MAG: hypothetical protein OEM24_05040 [Paracoccaceae bacterium]|nr:hypothetical protein [Paracoccaceae bacterium]
MPLPLIPIAAAALTAFAVARAVRPARIDQRGEDALDATEEGIGLSRVPGREQTSATARLRRVIRLGPHGPGLEIDAGLLARFRLRRV